MDLTGSIVAERYRVEGLLGAGGMGEVYRAVHVDSEYPVALKLMLPRDERGILLPRFQREARLAARLRHPNVVQLLDFGRWEQSEHNRERYYLAMELVDGLPLTTLLDAGLSVGASCELVAQVSEALAHVHAREVLHRDIKPDNILVIRTEDGRLLPKVTDFGISAAMGEDDGTRLTQEGSFLGTPAYMAPEQVMGAHGVGPAADLYALGVILYRLITGRLPFEERGTRLLMVKLNQEVNPPTLRDGSQLDELQAEVIARVLSRKPEERYSHAIDLCKALAPFRQSTPLDQGTWDALIAQRQNSGVYTQIGGNADATLADHDLPRGIRKQDAAAWEQTLWGRSHELQILDDSAHQVEEGQARIVLLRGPAGIGKSALLERLAVELDESGRFGLIRGSCRSGGGIMPALRSALERRLGTVGMVQSAVYQILKEFLARFGDDDESELSELLALLRPESEAAVVDAGERRRRNFATMARMLRRLTRERPVFAAIDDLSAGGPDALSFLEFLAAETAYEPMPLLLVGTVAEGREHSDFLKSFQRGGSKPNPGRRTLDIGPVDLQLLAEGLSAQFNLATPLAKEVAMRAGGNPLFALHLARTPEAMQGSSSLATSTTGTLPPQLKAILETYLVDSLEHCSDPKRARNLLLCMALLGEQAPVEILEELVEEPDELDDDLDMLIEQGVLIEIDEGATIAFSNGLLHDVLGAAMGPRKARRLHRRAAGLYAEGGKAGGSGAAGNHWYAAGDKEKAVNSWLDAQREELAAGNSMLLARWGQSALDLMPESDPRRGACALSVGRCLRDLARINEARQILATLVKQEQVDEALRAGELLCELEQDEGRGQAWQDWLDHMQERLPEAGDSGRAAFLRAKAFFINTSTQDAQAIELATEALELSAPGEDAQRAAARLTWANIHNGRLAEAVDAAKRALDEAGDRLDLRAEALRLVYMAEGSSGRFESAMTMATEALELQRRLGRHARAVTFANDVAMGLLIAGIAKPARGYCEEAVDKAERLGLPTESIRGRLMLVLADLLEGETERAFGDCEQLAEDLQNADITGFERLMGLTRAWTLAATGHIKKAIDILDSMEGDQGMPATNTFMMVFLEGIGLELAKRPDSVDRARDYLAMARQAWTRSGNHLRVGDIEKRAAALGIKLP